MVRKFFLTVVMGLAHARQPFLMCPLPAFLADPILVESPAVMELQRLRGVSAGRYVHHGSCQVRERSAFEPQRDGAARATALKRAHQVRSG